MNFGGKGGEDRGHTRISQALPHWASNGKELLSACQAHPRSQAYFWRSYGQVNGLFNLARRFSLSLLCPTPHGQYSIFIELGVGQMAVNEADMVKDLSTQCEGWQMGKGCGGVQLGGLPWLRDAVKPALGK